jgi:hypothetical protein
VIVRAVSLVLVLAVASCDRGRPSVEVVHTSIGGDVVARVGDVTIPASLVGAVAGAQHTDVHVALDHLIDDALAAQGARAAGDDRESSVAWTIDSIFAHTVVDRIARDARAPGPPNDDELTQLTRMHWLDVDLPEQARVVHAVVRTPKDPSQNAAARALAAQIASAVAGAKDTDDFKARAAAVPKGPFDVVIEELPPFVADGRFAEARPSMIDPRFAKGAFSLKSPGDTSGVVESAFGWHVIRMIERLPPKEVPADVRRAKFADEAITHRGRVALDALLESRRASTAVAILPDAEARMAEVSRSESP